MQDKDLVSPPEHCQHLVPTEHPQSKQRTVGSKAEPLTAATQVARFFTASGTFTMFPVLNALIFEAIWQCVAKRL